MKSLCAVLFLILSTATFASGQCSEAEKQKLMAWDKALGDATRTGDRAFLQTAYADDYMGIVPWGRIDKNTTVDNAIRNAERERANPQGPAKINYDYYEITCTPTSAVVTHRSAATTTVGGKEQTNYSRAVHVLEKRSGNWMLISNAGSPLDDAAQLLYIEREWNDASIKRDAAWFERNYADDATDISGRTGALNRKSDVVASIRNDKDVLESAELSNMGVRMEGNVAVVTGINHVKGRDEKGQPFDRRVRFSDVFVKRDGRWQVLSTQGTDMK